MKIQISTVGLLNRVNIDWPEGWPVPQKGAAIDHPEAGSLFVRTVIWYPQGAEDEDISEPFVYVVVGPSPRGIGIDL